MKKKDEMSRMIEDFGFFCERVFGIKPNQSQKILWDLMKKNNSTALFIDKTKRIKMKKHPMA